MLISVVTPVYNGEEYLEECIESVLRQTHAYIEFIIVNDGSTDNTAEIIKKYLRDDSRIKYISIENGGVSNARNIGIEASLGTYVALLDSDDIAKDDRIEKQFKFMVNCGAEVCGCGVEVFGKRGMYVELPFINDDDIKLQTIFNSPFVNSGSMFLGSTLKKYSYNTRLQFAEDYDLFVRMLLDNRRFSGMDEALVKYRVHQHQSTFNVSNVFYKQKAYVSNNYIANLKIKGIGFDKEQIKNLKISSDKSYKMSIIEFNDSADLINGLYAKTKSKALIKNFNILAIRNTHHGLHVYKIWKNSLINDCNRGGAIKLFVMCMLKLEYRSYLYQKIIYIYQLLIGRPSTS